MPCEGSALPVLNGVHKRALHRQGKLIGSPLRLEDFSSVPLKVFQSRLTDSGFRGQFRQVCFQDLLQHDDALITQRQLHRLVYTP